MAEYTSNRPRAYSNPNKRAIRQLLAAEACEPMARRMAAEHPDRFKFHPTTWGKFPDGTDKIIIGGYTPTNELAGEHVCLRRPSCCHAIAVSDVSPRWRTSCTEVCDPHAIAATRATHRSYCCAASTTTT